MTEWTSVKDSRPYPKSGIGWGRMVLTLYDSGVMCVESMFYYQATRPSVQSTAYFAGEKVAGCKAKVTHWMDLPEAPCHAFEPLDCTHDRLITLGTSEDGLEEEYKCQDCGRVLSTLDK